MVVGRKGEGQKYSWKDAIGRRGAEGAETGRPLSHTHSLTANQKEGIEA